MARFTFACTIVSVIALGNSVCVTPSNQDERIVVTDLSNVWIIEPDDYGSISWDDKSREPPWSLSDALSKCNELCELLDPAHEETGAWNWSPESISFHGQNSLNGDHCVYFVELVGERFPAETGIHIAPSLSLLMLLDGTVLFDDERCDEAIAAVLSSHPDVFSNSVSESTRELIRRMRSERFGFRAYEQTHSPAPSPRFPRK